MFFGWCQSKRLSLGYRCYLSLTILHTGAVHGASALSWKFTVSLEPISGLCRAWVHLYKPKQCNRIWSYRFAQNNNEILFDVYMCYNFTGGVVSPMASNPNLAFPKSKRFSLHKCKLAVLLILTVVNLFWGIGKWICPWDPRTYIKKSHIASSFEWIIAIVIIVIIHSKLEAVWLFF